jgi:hypothetical protein
MDVDITSALRTLVPIPSTLLVGVQAASATATAECAGGTAQLTGSTQVTGLTVLGQALPTDRAVTQTVNVVNAGTIDPSQLSAAGLPAPLNGLPLVVLQPLLDALPDIAVPATVAEVRVTPGAQTVEGGTLTQRGQQVSVVIAGQTIVDVTLGQASVSRGDVDCGQAVAQAQLSCVARKLALIDVLNRGTYTPGGRCHRLPCVAATARATKRGSARSDRWG